MGHGAWEIFCFGVGIFAAADEYATQRNQVLAGTRENIDYFKVILEGAGRGATTYTTGRVLYDLLMQTEQVIRQWEYGLRQTAVEVSVTNLDSYQPVFEYSNTPYSDEQWYNYFQETYGAENVYWQPRSYEHIKQYPEILNGSTQEEVGRILGEGWTTGTYGSAETGWKYYTPGDDSIFYHPGEGYHTGSYYGYSNGISGKTKIIDPSSGYIHSPSDKANIIMFGKG